jgi:hypothetical protein
MVYLPSETLVYIKASSFHYSTASERSHKTVFILEMFLTKSMRLPSSYYLILVTDVPFLYESCIVALGKHGILIQQ